jgi:DNA-binding MarR family transcriptional regulator
MEPTTFSAMKAMEALGYIERRQAPENKKNMYVYLTPKGRALQKKLVPLAEQTNQVSTQGLSAQEVQATRGVLLKLLENLAADEQLWVSKAADKSV